MYFPKLQEINVRCAPVAQDYQFLKTLDCLRLNTEDVATALQANFKEFRSTSGALNVSDLKKLGCLKHLSALNISIKNGTEPSFPTHLRRLIDLKLV